MRKYLIWCVSSSWDVVQRSCRTPLATLVTISAEAVRGPSSSTHNVSPDEHLLHLPELLSIGAGLVHLAQRNVHEVVTIDEVSVEGDAVLELDKLQ